MRMSSAKSTCARAAYTSSPLEDGSLKSYRVFRAPISKLNSRALEDSGLGLTAVQIDRSKNMFALGLMYWMYSRPLETTIHWIDEKFGKIPAIAEANRRTLRAGYHYGETTEMFATHYHVPSAKLKPGVYRNITGNEATALGLLTAAKLAGKPSSTPATPLPRPATFCTNSPPTNASACARSRLRMRSPPSAPPSAPLSEAPSPSPAPAAPASALKSEAIALAVTVELPLLVINVQPRRAQHRHAHEDGTGGPPPGLLRP